MFRKSLIIALVLATLASGRAPAEEMVLDTGTGRLAGTLLTPAGGGPWPVVLIIAGSGPTDRDGNSAMIPGPNHSLRQLAEGLAARGVASLRYDKRGVGASQGAARSEQDLRFDHFIDDARLWCRLLQADARFSSLTVAGHSEGAQIGLEAAWLAGADGLATLAGPGRPVFAILREQLAGQLSARSRVRAEEVMRSLELGRLVEDPPQELTILFRPSVQPYLMSWQRHDPAVDIARFDGPVTVVQGTTDIQVSVEDARLLAAAVPRARLVLLEGINHIFKPVTGRQPLAHQLSLGDSTLVFSPEAVAAVADLCGQAEAHRRQKTAALQRVGPPNGAGAPDAGPAADLFAAAADLPDLGARVGFWARRLLEQGAAYRFGLAEDGYVARGLLVQDQAMDCVSFMYRCVELARSGSPEEALAWALRTRFPGAPLDTLVAADGRVDYDRPEHLDFSLDMVRSASWGRDVTAQLDGAAADTVGSARYAPGSFRYVPTGSLDRGQLREGDILWLVLDPADPRGAALRREHGLVIGHLGVVLVEGGQVWLAHAAAGPLAGWYDTAGLVKVPLEAYLQRVGKFSGVVVTRP